MVSHAKNRTKKIITIFVVTTMLVFNSFPTGIGAHAEYGTANAEHLPNLLDVQLLENINVEADLTNGEQFYHLALSLTGKGLANAELLSPDRIAVFYAPDLAGKLSVSELANVRVDILPIKMDDLPLLDSAVGSLIGIVNDLVAGLTTGLHDVINGTALSGLVQINGLDHLQTALDHLNSLDKALADLLTYEDQVEAIVHTDGSIKVDFTDGLGNHLETAIKEVVTNTVTELLDAIDGIEIVLLDSTVFLGSLLQTLVLDPVVNPLKSAVVHTATPIVEEINELTVDVAGLQVLGDTEVTLNANVEKNALLNKDIPLYGAGVSTGNINLELLSSLGDSTTVNGFFLELIVPNELPFEKTRIGAGQITINRDPTADWSIHIRDTRGQGAKWKLFAKVSEPLQSPDGHILKEADEEGLFFKKENGNDQFLKYGAHIHEGTTGTDPIQTIEWNDYEGIFLRINPMEAQPNVTYSTTITWTLEDAP